ncbi:MAG: hypothetical protein R3F43_31110 [bacterium]
MKRPAIVLGLGLCLLGTAQAQGPDAEPETDAQAGLDLPVKTTLSSQFRMLAVVDEDPANDQLLLYGLRVRGEVFKGGTVFLGAGLRQLFVAEPDESGVDLQDTQVGFAWKTPVSFGADAKLSLTQEASVFLPTSRTSRVQDLYLAPQVRLGFAFEPVAGLTVAGGPRFRYRFHEFAERAGRAGGMNTQLDTGLSAGIDYAILDSKTYGRIGVGVGAGTNYVRKYDSRESYESDASDQGVWYQQYDWEAHVGYGYSVFDLGFSVEQGGNVLRDGVVNTFFVHRDETQLAFTLSASL